MGLRDVRYGRDPSERVPGPLADADECDKEGAAGAARLPGILAKEQRGRDA